MSNKKSCSLRSKYLVKTPILSTMIDLRRWKSLQGTVKTQAVNVHSVERYAEKCCTNGHMHCMLVVPISRVFDKEFCSFFTFPL